MRAKGFTTTRGANVTKAPARMADRHADRFVSKLADRVSVASISTSV
jgi:hypothetical protein